MHAGIDAVGVHMHLLVWRGSQQSIVDSKGPAQSTSIRFHSQSVSNADGSDSNNSLIFTRIATTTTTNATHNLSGIVDQNILSTSPTLLKDLKEYITYTNGVITKHSVEYAGLSFDYNQIDSLITTVVRDGDFTAEFTQEINDYLKTELNITYSVAVEVVGAANIDGVILMVAGSDGNYVG